MRPQFALQLGVELIPNASIPEGHWMIAYCTLKDGHIHFADAKPRGTIAIASHADTTLLQSVVQSLASTETVTQGGKTITSNALCVPWFSTIKYSDEKRPLIEKFAQKVQERLRPH